MEHTSWLVEGAVRDPQTITSQWNPSQQLLIQGVVVHEVKNVPKSNGRLTEIFRADWFADVQTISQVFEVVVNPGCITAWHAHEITTDRLFVTRGLMRIALYDNRAGSDTRGRLNIFTCGSLRPMLIVVPPKIWHGVQNVDVDAASVLNIVDHAYDYTAPDHWRVDADHTALPDCWVK